MAKKKRARKKVDDEYTSLSIKIEKHEVKSEASLNIDLKMDRPIFSRDDDPVYEFVTSLEISGVSTYPKKRAGDQYEITIRGQEPHTGNLKLTLHDVQARDDDRCLMYRTYRGERYPVYDAPPGIATISRRHGTRIWDAWVYFVPRLVSDMLVLLSQSKPLFLAIQERKVGRKRWVESLTLQTTDPAEE